MTTYIAAILSGTCSVQTLLVVLAATLLAYKVWTVCWNCYYRMQVTASDSTISQKLELLGSSTIRRKFTVGSEVGAIWYDNHLGRALVALDKSHNMTALKDWKGAYKALNEARACVSQYDFGHLPPRDMPKPRALA